MKLYIKDIKSCFECPAFINDRGYFCNILDKPVLNTCDPPDCPLPQLDDFLVERITGYDGLDGVRGKG